MHQNFKPCAIVLSILLGLGLIGHLNDKQPEQTIVDKFQSYSISKESKHSQEYKQELLAADYNEFAVPAMESIYTSNLNSHYESVLMYAETYLEVTSPNEYTDRFTKIVGAAKECIESSRVISELDVKYNNNIQAYYDYISQGNYYHTFYIGNLIEQTADGHYIYTVSANPLSTEIYALKLSEPATSDSAEYNVFPSGETMLLTSYDNSQSFNVSVLNEVSQDYIDDILYDYDNYNSHKSIVTDRKNIISGLVVTQIP